MSQYKNHFTFKLEELQAYSAAFKAGKTDKAFKDWLRGYRVQATREKNPRLQQFNKPVVLKQGKFESVKDAAQKLGVSESTIRNWVKRDRILAAKNTGTNKLRPRPVVTPHGVFRSTTEAAESHDVSSVSIRNWIIEGREGFYYADTVELNTCDAQP